jgi:hypothetical protein
MDTGFHREYMEAVEMILRYWHRDRYERKMIV